MFALPNLFGIFKFVLCSTICSKYSKNFHALIHCSYFQIYSLFQNLFSGFKKCSCFKKLSKFVLRFKICSQDSKNVRTFRKYLCSNFVLNFKILFSKFKNCSEFRKSSCFFKICSPVQKMFMFLKPITIQKIVHIF